MFRLLACRHTLVAALALGAASCANAYVYRTTRLAAEPARGPAQPALSTPATGAREVGLIEALLQDVGGEGLHDSEAEFYPRLAQLAGALGGTHFVVLRTARGRGAVITALTASVIVEEPADAEQR